MSAILSSNVAYAILRNKKLEDGRKIVNATLTFGNGALTYPSGGVPVLMGMLGFAYNLNSFIIESTSGIGYFPQYNYANVSIQLFQAPGVPAHNHPLLLKDGAVVDGATTRANAGTNLLGANTGSNITVAGGGANGGIQNNTAGADGALVELGTGVAPAQIVLHIVAVGY